MGPPKKRARKHKGKPAEITAESLREAALRYLERYVASSDRLRQVLMRRVHRAAREQDVDVERARGWVDEIVDRFCQVGLLDDEVYARGQARRMLRQGTSVRGIRAKLAGKGVDQGAIDQAVESLAEDLSDPDLAAAVTYARRRRLGPFGPPEGRDERRDKELAALGRAGFPYDLAARVVEAESAEELEGPEGDV